MVGPRVAAISGAIVALVAGLLAATIAFAAPAAAAQPAPTVLYPPAGQTVSYNGDLLIEVSPVPGSSGYLYGFFQNGAAVWENYSHEHTLSGTEYAIRRDTTAHQALHPGGLDIWVRALVGGEWTDAAIVTVTLAQSVEAGPQQPSGQQPPFFCIVGADGSGCGINNRAPSSTMTWNQYLDYLVAYADGTSDLITHIDCAGTGPGNITGCLGVVLDKYPGLSTAADIAGCASGVWGDAVDAIRGCLGIGPLGMRAIVSAIRGAANLNPGLMNFLNSPMST